MGVGTKIKTILKEQKKTIKQLAADAVGVPPFGDGCHVQNLLSVALSCFAMWQMAFTIFAITFMAKLADKLFRVVLGWFQGGFRVVMERSSDPLANLSE